MPPATSSRQAIAVIGLMLAMILPWVIMSVVMVANADNLWLAEGYQRWSAGATLTQSFYEVNPPLSLLIYAVPVELSAIFGINLHHAIFFYTLAVTTLAAGILYRLLWAVDFLGAGERLLLLAGFIFGSTLLTTGYFGERDHFVAMALVLLLLTQFLITYSSAGNRLALIALAFVCGFIILLKPHYLFLPALMLVYRAFKRRSLMSVLRDGDGWALVAAVMSYALVLYFCFPEYLSEILPAVVEYYGLRKAYDMVAMMSLQLWGGAILFALSARLFVPDLRVRRFVEGGLVLVALAVIPYIVQGLGYAYHLIPATTLLWMALGVILYHAVCGADANKPYFAVVMAVILCAVGAYAAKMPQRSFISNAQYAQLPLVRAARQCATPPCHVFIFGPSFEISYLVSYYAQARYASRFGALFFLPRQMQGESGPDQVALFRNMTVADFEHYQPDIVMLASFEMLHGHGDFDLLDYLKADAGFRTLWQNYKRTGYIEAPFEDYLRDMQGMKDDVMRFDIYQRVR